MKKQPKWKPIATKLGITNASFTVDEILGWAASHVSDGTSGEDVRIVVKAGWLDESDIACVDFELQVRE